MIMTTSNGRDENETAFATNSERLKLSARLGIVRDSRANHTEGGFITID